MHGHWLLAQMLGFEFIWKDMDNKIEWLLCKYRYIYSITGWCVDFSMANLKSPFLRSGCK